MKNIKSQNHNMENNAQLLHDTVIILINLPSLNLHLY